MHLDLTDAETLALLNLLVETIEADRYPYSPRKIGGQCPRPFISESTSCIRAG